LSAIASFHPIVSPLSFGKGGAENGYDLFRKGNSFILVYSRKMDIYFEGEVQIPYGIYESGYKIKEYFENQNSIEYSHANGKIIIDKNEKPAI
jgi:hypothetical protein